MTPDGEGAAELPPERKARLARNLAWMMGASIAILVVSIGLIVNAVAPCASGGACRASRGMLVVGCGVLVAAATALFARRVIRSALDSRRPD